jgi:sterol desaturase/sphingolipid hydroxylase (fatty acid hydroxylase superfamily)
MVGVTVGALTVAERLRPLRRRRDPGLERIARNLTIGALAAATTVSGAAAIVDPVQRWAEHRRVGLLWLVRLPRVLRVIVGFLVLDYSLFLWHWLNHRSYVLWRFHAVHHLDLDLDTTTGVRFHFGELALSIGLRVAQVLLFGVDWQTTQWWSRALFVSVLFHHSNLALGPRVEQHLARVVTTPRMHGIHHSMRAAETNANFSSLLSWWDHLHGRFRLDVPQDAIVIGVPGFRSRVEVGLRRSLTLPFRGAPPPPLTAGTNGAT